MQIATALYTHALNQLTLDTIESIQIWMTGNIMVVVDGANIEKLMQIPNVIVKRGLRHGISKSTHKNMAFSINQLYSEWPDADWYCFLEPDVLILNDSFKRDLDRGWIRGTNHRHGPEWEIPLLDKIVGEKVRLSCYFLGCIMFLHREFVIKLEEINFYDKLIEHTQDYESHQFPDFKGYSFQEEMFPSIANALYENSDIELTGKKYFCQWPHEVNPHELPPAASIVHPIKNNNNPIREHARKIRERFKK